VILKDKIAAVEAQLQGALTELRATYAQTTDKGDIAEEVFRAFLRKYLPRRLEVGQGEVIDTGEQRSGQTDIVIVSEDHPRTFTQDLPGLFLVEGVCGAGEAKVTLTSDGLDRAIDSSLCFKRLESKPGTNTIASTNKSDVNRFYKYPPYFLIAFESQLKLDTVLAKIAKFAKSKGFHPNDVNKILDAVFVIDRGWAINLGDGKGSLYSLNSEGKRGGGWVAFHSDAVLFDFLGWLSAVMPRVLRFGPILPLYGIVPGA